MTETAIISNEKKLISYLNHKDEVKTVEVPNLSDLTWMQLQEWMDEDASNTEGSVIRDHYCRKSGIALKYEYELSEEEKSSWGKTRDHKENQVQDRLSALLKCVTPLLKEIGVKKVEFEWAGSGDAIDYADAHIILKENHDEYQNKGDGLYRHWNEFVDHLARHIVYTYHTGSFNNEGSGGSAEWNLENNSLEFSTYYNEMSQVDDESGVVEIA